MSQRGDGNGGASSSRGQNDKGSSVQRKPASTFNRVRVSDLLNDEDVSDTRAKPKKEKASSSESRAPPKLPGHMCRMEYCGRRFPTAESLVAHQKRIHPPPTDFICTFCNSSFSSPPNLRKHIRSVHKKMKRFKCEQCPSAFEFRDGLHRHTQMVHDQIRPYPCAHCPLKFKTKAHLSKHSFALHIREYETGSSKGESSGQR